MKRRKRSPSGAVSRRDFLRGAGAAVSAVSGGLLVAEPSGATPAPGSAGVVGPGEVPVTLRINGKEHRLKIEPRVTLLDALRNRLDLTGAKKVCDRATCGACTVIIDGHPVYSCTTLAIDVEGQHITTIEGLAPEDQLHPVMAAFVEHDAQQCGFCTPGFVMACKAFLDKYPNPTLEDVKQGLSGNLCRCGTYAGIRQVALRAKA